MEKIMKLAALMREAKELVDEINKEGEYDILSASVDLNEDDAYAEGKQGTIHFYKVMPDFGISPMRNLHKGDGTKILYKESVEVDGVKCFRLIDEKEAGENAKIAV